MRDNEAQVRRMSQRMAATVSMAKLLQTTAEHLRETAERIDKSDVAELSNGKGFFDAADAVTKLTRAITKFEGKLERMVRKAKQQSEQASR
jgi:hypothetical protein